MESLLILGAGCLFGMATTGQLAWLGDKLGQPWLNKLAMVIFAIEIGAVIVWIAMNGGGGVPYDEYQWARP